MKVLERPETDPARVAFFMPTAEGPCRFGQYAPYLRQILDAHGYQNVEILSPTSRNAYEGLGTLAKPFVRTGWRALLCADLLQKLLLLYRPYEERRGDTEAVYEESPRRPVRHHRADARRARRAVAGLRDSHGALPRPLPQAGAAARTEPAADRRRGRDLLPPEHVLQREPGARLEDYGAEAWLSDIVEWIWYTNSEHFRKLKLAGRIWTAGGPGRLGAQARAEARRARAGRAVRRRISTAARSPTSTRFCERARPYLPREGAFGEMVLNVGKAVYLAKKGAAGIIDISPFTCMNGIVCEAIYPRLSRDLGGIPIRNFYFDGTQSDLDRDLGVYMELARSYQKKRG